MSLSAFIAIELHVAHPLLNLRLLGRRNFGLGIVANFLLGIALYGSVFILPVYLSRIQGYNSEQIGFVLAWTGLPQLALIPLVPRLMRRFDPRLVIGFGFVLFAASNFMNVDITADTAATQLLIPNIIRAIGQALVFAPLSAVATAGIEAANAGSASALFNMMRNLGGAIGIAALQTFQSKREQFHSNILSTAVSGFSEVTRARIDQLTHYFLAHGVSDPATATHQAVIAIGQRVRQQANIMAFGDTFALLGVALLIALVATLLLRKPEPGATAGAAH
jgi:DHA2 family multidrug resistance protein